MPTLRLFLALVIFGILVYSGGQTLTCYELDLRALMLKVDQLSAQKQQILQDLYAKRSKIFAQAEENIALMNNSTHQNAKAPDTAAKLVKSKLQTVLKTLNSFRADVNSSINAISKLAERILLESMNGMKKTDSLLTTDVSILLNETRQATTEVVKIQASSQCPDGWTTYRGSCYFFSEPVESSFSDAAKTCGALGSHLVFVETQAENNFLKGFLSMKKDKSHWMGLTDQRSEGTWLLYGTDTEAPFLDWHPAQPDDWKGAEDCVHFTTQSSDHQWNDYDCTEPYFFICEKDLEF